MSGKRVLRWLVAVSFVVASCSGSDDDDAAGGGGEQRGGGEQPGGLFGEEESGIGAELAAARAESPDGLLPTEFALDLFSSIYGEVPGGTARFEEVRTGDASLAIRAVGARWGELDEDTRAAIQERLGSDDASDETILGAPQRRMGARAFTRPAGGDPDEPATGAELIARVERLRDEITQHLGFTQQKQLTLQFVPASTWVVQDDEVTVADATPMRGGVSVGEGDHDTCRIRLNEDFPPTDDVLAHEVFHCFQYEMTPLDVYFAVPDWIAEGSADWVAANVADADATIRGHFIKWQQSTVSLYTVDYAAVGYYWTIETMGIDPWDEIPRMLSSGNRGHDAHHPVLDPKELVSRSGTGAFMKSVDGTPVDDIWDLTPEAVPDEIRTGYVVSAGSPLDRSIQKPDFSRSAATQINVDGDALDVELTAEVGAVQEVGGALDTFEGEYSNRICFEEGSAHVVFLNLAAVDSGPVGVKLSVPSDDDDCEDEEEECPDATIPEPAGFTLVSSLERECGDSSRTYQNSLSGFSVSWYWVNDPDFAGGFQERQDYCAGIDPLLWTCEALQETFTDGYLDGRLIVSKCSESSGRPGADNIWEAELFGESEHRQDNWVLHVLIRGAGTNQWDCGAGGRSHNVDITGEGGRAWPPLVAAARGVLTGVSVGP